MSKTSSHPWAFRPRFRRHAFGWRSQPAIQRVREAVSEIKRVARKDRALAAEGAVLFLERLSPAIEQVDSSSGAIGTAVNKAITDLAAVIAAAPVDEATRHSWLERLWQACQDDDIPYLEQLGYHWGELCVSQALASHWADELLGTCRLAWSPDPTLRGFFKGTTHCLSALLIAQRYDDLLELLEMAPYDLWHYRQFGVRALAALGRKTEAIRYAEAGKDAYQNPGAVAQACEEILLSSGLVDEAYRRYGLLANRAGTYLAWYRAVAKKYPHVRPAQVLDDLVAFTPGEEGKWFAAAKDAGLFDEALALAQRSPCAPQTLTRAARDFAGQNPGFALGAGMAALHWLVEGYGYDVTAGDVLEAYTHTLEAAERQGCVETTRQRIRDLVATEAGDNRFVTRVLEPQLGLA
jgi:tetratricopeptide (TPR) repeat protein